jgi:hypothetical protein
MPKLPRKPTRAKQFAAIERISVCGVGGGMGPLALWIYASAFWKAATELPETEVPFEPVRYYLSCHSIELALKAFLSLNGDTMLSLSDSALGHNLVAILTTADAKGLAKKVVLTPDHRAEIARAAAYYGGKVFEYPAVGEAMVGYPSLPKLTVLLEASQALVESLAKSCMEAP